MIKIKAIKFGPIEMDKEKPRQHKAMLARIMARLQNNDPAIPKHIRRFSQRLRRACDGERISDEG